MVPIAKFAGPPGTGKSTALLNIVDSLIGSGIQPENVIFTTYTKAGANEARDRAAHRFNLPLVRLPYFRTLHSLCFNACPTRSVMSHSDWCRLASTIGVSFSSSVASDEGVTRGHTKGDQLLSLYNLSRVNQVPLAQIHHDSDGWMTGGWDLKYSELDHFARSIQAYKEGTGKIDFNDMLEIFLAEGPKFHSDYLIVDEAQDLSNLQWKVVEKLTHGAKEVYIAGDDDQALHEWNGANPRKFIEIAQDRTTVLPQSYRIPKSVHVLAEKIISRVTVRIQKQYLPREDEGKVEFIRDLSQLKLETGTWLLLARNHSLLEDYTRFLHQHGYLYSGTVNKDQADLISAIGYWQDLREGKTVTGLGCKLAYRFMSTRDRVAWGSKGKLELVGDASMLDIKELHKTFGLLTNAPWETAFDAVDPEEKSYLLAVQKREGLRAVSRIAISTIHGAKGREADHVVLRPEMSYRTHQAYGRKPDSEHRVWYVAVTRARKSLHILNSSSVTSYNLK